MESYQRQFEVRLLTEMYQSARITLVIPLVTAGLMPLQNLLNKKICCHNGFLGLQDAGIGSVLKMMIDNAMI